MLSITNLQSHKSEPFWSVTQNPGGEFRPWPHAIVCSQIADAVKYCADSSVCKRYTWNVLYVATWVLSLRYVITSIRTYSEICGPSCSSFRSLSQTAEESTLEERLLVSEIESVSRDHVPVGLWQTVHHGGATRRRLGPNTPSKHRPPQV